MCDKNLDNIIEEIIASAPPQNKDAVIKLCEKLKRLINYFHSTKDL